MGKVIIFAFVLVAGLMMRSLGSIRDKRLEGYHEAFKKGDFKTCIDEVDTYIKAFPNDEMGHYHKAMAYKHLGDDAAYVASIDQAAKLGQRNVTVLLEAGECYYLKEDYEQSEEYLKQGTLMEKNPKLHYYLGLIYVKQNNATKAIKSFKSALSMETGNQEYINHALYRLYLEQGDEEKMMYYRERSASYFG